MPARTCGTARPTNGTRVVTLAPDWPVAGSMAHSENVEYCGSPSSLIVTPSAARRCADPGKVTATTLAHVTTTATKYRRVIGPPGGAGTATPACPPVRTPVPDAGSARM